MKTPPAWHADARRMLENGSTVREIATALEHSDYAVKYALDLNGTRDQKASLKLLSAQRHAQNKQDAINRATINHRRILVDRETKLIAAREFAAGLIDREQFMRRITKSNSSL